MSLSQLLTKSVSKTATAVLLVLPMVAACQKVNFASTAALKPEGAVLGEQTGPDEASAGVPGSPNGGTDPAHDQTGGTTVPVPVKSCTDIAATSRLTKILFVVDMSGSNRAWTQDNGMALCSSSDMSGCTQPTDPNKSFRGGAIQDFFSRYKAKTNFNWGFLRFAGSSASSLINGKLTNNTSVMQSAISSFMGLADDGGTPYRAGLRLATSAIASDQDLNSAASPQYVVVLISDGFPTDYRMAGGAFDSSTMSADISGLLSIAPGRVTLSTIYYGQVGDPNAISLLGAMANKGGGQFANAGDTSGIRIDDVIPAKVCDR